MHGAGMRDGAGFPVEAGVGHRAEQDARQVVLAHAQFLKSCRFAERWHLEPSGSTRHVRQSGSSSQAVHSAPHRAVTHSRHARSLAASKVAGPESRGCVPASSAERRDGGGYVST
jgi:hypothetical protein